LTKREREILRFLLGGQFPGVEALRRQAEVALVSHRLDCCATVEFEVDTTRAERAFVAGEPVAVEARSKDEEKPYELLLFVYDGWLSSVELLHHAEEIGPSEFPAPDLFHEPTR
jgi:hypothetical protein